MSIDSLLDILAIAGIALLAAVPAVVILILVRRVARTFVLRAGMAFTASLLAAWIGLSIYHWADWYVFECGQREWMRQFLADGAVLEHGDLSWRDHRTTVEAAFPDGHPRAGSALKLVLRPYAYEFLQCLATAAVVSVVIASPLALGVDFVLNRKRRQ